MKKKASAKNGKSAALKRTVKVLYQNVGGEVYAFAQVGSEMYFAKVPIKARAVQKAKEPAEKDAA